MKIKNTYLHSFIVLAIGWTLFGVFFAAQGYTSSLYFNQSLPFTLFLSLWLICGYCWMLLTPLVVFLSEKFSFKTGRTGRSLLIHLCLAISVSILHLSAFVICRQLILGSGDRIFSFANEFQRMFFGEFHSDFLIYWTLVGIFHLRELNRRYLERERETARLALETSQLETKLATARLDALKMQLHPHFLFNTLNSISVLMREDVPSANKMLVQLSELLRVALKMESSQTISLQEELEFLRGYLEIEQMRFQDRLIVDFVVEEQTLDAQIPNLILQPLVENAIRHGLAPLEKGGKIIIESRRENGFVELSISDNGRGFDVFSENTNGIGLKNTRERLEKLYGEQQTFEVISGEKGGLRVTIKIPYQKQ